MRKKSPVSFVFRLPMAFLAGALAGLSAASAWATLVDSRDIAQQEACRKSPTAVHVTVQNVRSSDGALTALLFDDNPDNFLKEGRGIDKARVLAQKGETKICLVAPGSGSYSIALYHDEDGNKKFNRNFLGIPSEGYGFSRNPGFAFSAPDVEEISFQVNGEPVELDISIRYLVD